MKTTLRRFLGIALAVALMVTCTISGLVLPVSADESASQFVEVDLLAGNANIAESYTVKTGETVTIDTGVVLSAGQRYAFRWASTAGLADTDAGGTLKTTVAFTTNGTSKTTYTLNTGNTAAGSTVPHIYQRFFTPSAATTTFSIVLASNCGTMVIGDFELCAVPDATSTTFNYIPGGDFEGEVPALFASAYTGATKSIITTDPADPNNKCLYYANGSKSGNYLKYDRIGSPPNGVWKLSFRFKGVLRIDGSQTYTANLENSGTVSVTENGGKTYYKADNWTSVDYYVDCTHGGANQMCWQTIYNLTGSSYKELWLDDVELYCLGTTTEISLNHSELNLFPGDIKKVTASNPIVGLNYIGPGEVAGKTNKGVIWSSDNPAVATVDTIGNVTAVAPGTANITVKLSQEANCTISATCAVTVKEPTVNQDLYFQDGIVKVPALQNSTFDILPLLKTADGYTVNTSNLTWNITGNKTVAWGKDGNYTGSAVTPVTLTNGVISIAAITSDNPENAWSLGNINPEISVTDEKGNRATAVIQWEYPETILSYDFDNTLTGNGAFDGKVTTESGNKYALLDAASHGSVPIKMPMLMEPNTLYRFSYRAKNTTTEKTNMRLRLYVYDVNNARSNAYNSAAETLAGPGTDVWTTYSGFFRTGDAPSSCINYSFYFSKVSGSTGGVAVDDICVTRVNKEGDSEEWMYSYGLFDKAVLTGKGEYTYESVGGNDTFKVKISGVNSTEIKMQDYNALKKQYVAYKVTFDKYGAQLKFNDAGASGWTGETIGARDSVRTFAASDSWESCSFVFAAGRNISRDDYASYGLGFTTTGDVYIDNLVIEPVSAAYVYYAGNTNGTLKVLTEDGTPTQLIEAAPGEIVYVTMSANSGYLPVLGSLKATDLNGNDIAILNNPNEMTDASVADGTYGGDGTTFSFRMPAAGTVRLSCEYVKTAKAQSFQWGTIASSVRGYTPGNGTTGVDGLRFCNRLYIEGLNNVEDVITVRDANGTERVITEIGAIARKAGTGELTLNAAGILKGVVYNPETTPNPRLTDFTERYMDFTVVISAKGDKDFSLDTQYECCAYITFDDGTTIYTTSMTRSAAETVALLEG